MTGMIDHVNFSHNLFYQKNTYLWYMLCVCVIISTQSTGVIDYIQNFKNANIQKREQYTLLQK